MNKRKVISLTLAAMMSAGMVLSGCDSDNNNGEKDKQLLRLVGYEYKTLDPTKVSDSGSFNTYTQVYEGLMREVTDIKENTKIEKAGCESYEVSEDKLTYTFHLRKDAKWSDGKPVKAQDYVYAWKKLTDPTNGSPYMTMLAELNVKGAEEIIAAASAKKDTKELLEKLGVEAKDDNTFVVTLSKATPYFINAMTFKGLVPIRQDLVESQGDKYGVDYKKVVYNGPFVVAEYQKGSKVVYKKNPNYWNAKSIKLEEADCPILNETTTVVKMFESGELDVAGASKDDLARLRKKAEAGEITLITGMETTSLYDYYNVQHGVLKNKKVRRALSMALDRKEMLDVVYKRNVPAYGLVTDGVDCGGKVYRKEVPEPIKCDKEEAKKLMTEGLKEEGVEPSKVNLKFLLGPKVTITSDLGDYVSRLYKDTFGINVQPDFTPDDVTFYDMLDKSDFDIAGSGWGADYDDVSSYFNVLLSNGSNNKGHFNNKEYDDLVTKASAETDPVKRVEMYKRAEQIAVYDEAAISPSFYRDVNSFRKNYVKGSIFNKFGGYYDLSQVYIEGKDK